MTDRSIFFCRGYLCNWFGYVRDVLVRDGRLNCPCCGRGVRAASGAAKIRMPPVEVNWAQWYQNAIERATIIQSKPLSFEDRLAAIAGE